MLPAQAEAASPLRTPPGDESDATRGEREGGRRRRRGRGGREGREAEVGAAAPVQPSAEVLPAGDMAFMPEPAAPEEVLLAATPVVEVTPIETMAARPADEPAAVIQPFALPVDDLRALAASAGLEWVNSDAERILVVQQAMANEPKPVHVPRLPRPRVIVDDGPLVLVETRKDLSQMKLPFEQQQPSA
jgi:ribonuclease E